VLSRLGASKIAVRSLSASAAVGAALEDNRDVDKKAQRAGVDLCTNDRRRTFRLVSKKPGTKPDFEAFDDY
jgi:hypothetical protein